MLRLRVVTRHDAKPDPDRRPYEAVAGHLPRTQAYVGRALQARPDEHVVDRLQDFGRAREGIALAEQPGVHVVEKWFALLLPHGISLMSAAAVDGALDFEQGVETPDRLQRDREIDTIPLVIPGLFHDVRQFEESSPRMALVLDRPGYGSPPREHISGELVIVRCSTTDKCQVR